MGGAHWLSQESIVAVIKPETETEKGLGSIPHPPLIPLSLGCRIKETPATW